jgi:hypothetical protein
MKLGLNISVFENYSYWSMECRHWSIHGRTQNSCSREAEELLPFSDSYHIFSLDLVPNSYHPCSHISCVWTWNLVSVVVDGRIKCKTLLTNIIEFMGLKPACSISAGVPKEGSGTRWTETINNTGSPQQDSDMWRVSYKDHVLEELGNY